MTVAQKLSEAGLEQYRELFEREAIAPEMLEALTDEELQQLGVSVATHRSALLAAFKKTPIAFFTKVGAAETRENRILEEVVLTTNNVQLAIQVTSRRVIVGTRTYSLQAIATVDTFSNVRDVDLLNSSAKTNLQLRKIVFGFLSCVSFASLIFFVTQSRDQLAGVSCGFFMGIVFLIIALTGRARTLLPTFSIRIQSTGPSNDLIQSLDKAAMERVSAALTTAITTLSM